MRVLVASDAIGPLTSRQAGQAIAKGWSRAEVRVTPIGAAGAGFITAFADLVGASVEMSAAGTATVTMAHRSGIAALGISGEESPSAFPYDPSSRSLGEALRRMLGEYRLRRVYLDLAGLPVHDAGAGMLAGLGATADGHLDRGALELAALDAVDVGAVADALGDTELVGVVPSDQLGQQLLGLRGITALRGHGAQTDRELLLQIDRALERFTQLVSQQHATQPGAGACGGLGFAVLALGGRLTTGPAVGLGSEVWGKGPGSEIAEFLRRGVDLVVTGCSVFDFATRGGGVVAHVAEAAAAVLSPCIVLAGEVVIGAREMRTMGVEAAYGVRETSQDQPDDMVGEAELRQLAHRVARSWSW